MMNEIWKDIIGYEGYYQISNMGNVKSLDRNIDVGNGNTIEIKGGLLATPKNGRGYRNITLSKLGKSKTYSIHRIVAKHFIENPYNKTQVNHLDKDKTNNCVYNLEWCTPKENMEHAHNNGFKKRNNRNDKSKISYKGISKKDKILNELNKNPNMSVKEVAEICETTIKYVYKVKAISSMNETEKEKYRNTKNKNQKERRNKKNGPTEINSIENIEGEIWRDVKNYEGLYEISSYGRIKSLDRTYKIVRNNKEFDVFRKGRLLSIQNNRRYYAVGLTKDGKSNSFLIHRLVAEAFIHKPDGCNVVNHKDNNQHNNRFDNLEWVTQSENIKHSYKISNRIPSNKKLGPDKPSINKKDIVIDFIIDNPNMKISKISEILKMNPRYVSKVKYRYKDTISKGIKVCKWDEIKPYKYYKEEGDD